MIYQNNNHNAWAVLVLVVLCAFLVLGLLLKDKLDGSGTAALPIPNTGDTGWPAGGGGTQPYTSPVHLQEAPAASATPQPTATSNWDYATQTAIVQDFNATATGQALASRATQVGLDIIQTQAAQQSTSAAGDLHATQVAQNWDYQEKIRSQIITRTAEADLRAIEGNRTSAQSAEPWIDLGLKVVIGLVILALGVAAVIWLLANAAARRQAAITQYYAEKRQVLEAQNESHKMRSRATK
jgi:hypothetical protein